MIVFASVVSACMGANQIPRSPTIPANHHGPPTVCIGSSFLPPFPVAYKVFV
jgi:hypothetical protein